MHAVLVRTTVTLDDDVVELIRRRMTEKQLSFKRALNQAVRDGAAGRPAVARFATRTADLWVPSVNVDRAFTDLTAHSPYSARRIETP